MNARDALKSLARVGLSRGYGAMARLGLYKPETPPVAYLVERGAGWVIRWDGESYVKAIEARHPGTVALGDRPECVHGRIAHFGSQFVWDLWKKALDPSNRVVVTFFHGAPEDGQEMARHIESFLDGLPSIAHVITAASKVERRLLSWGVPRQKLSLVPLGIDVSHFCPPTPQQRQAARLRFGVPEGATCIGSFQKDGTGWGEGMLPKLIKGPDLFVEAAAKLSRDFPVFVLLTGPARGYVKHRLEALGIAYAHVWLKNYADVAAAFHALDLYLVTSREEGGPKAILESLASGVPLVSSRVGMAEDLLENGANGFLVEVGDTQATVDSAARMLSDPVLRAELQREGRARAMHYDWPQVASPLYEVYEKLLREAAPRP